MDEQDGQDVDEGKPSDCGRLPDCFAFLFPILYIHVKKVVLPSPLRESKGPRRLRGGGLGELPGNV